MQLAVALLRCGARGSIERHPSRPSHQFATELMERANNKQINHVAVAGWMCVPSTVHTRKKRAIACARKEAGSGTADCLSFDERIRLWDSRIAAAPAARFSRRHRGPLPRTLPCSNLLASLYCLRVAFSSLPSRALLRLLSAQRHEKRVRMRIALHQYSDRLPWLA